MSRQESLQRVLDDKLIAVIRGTNADKLVSAIRALHEGGVGIIEITMTVPQALPLLARLRSELPDDVLLGAGTILDPETARAALLAGAEFVVGPTLNPEVIRLCHRYDRLVMPGAFTPTEILTAWEAGADVVKVFPAEVGGPRYFKAIRGPLPQVRIMPTGGVDLETAPAFLKAGACCLGVGSSLVEPTAVANGDLERLQSLASQYVEIVRQHSGG